MQGTLIKGRKKRSQSRASRNVSAATCRPAGLGGGSISQFGEPMTGCVEDQGQALRPGVE